MFQPSRNNELEQMLQPDILCSKNIIIAEDDENNYILVKEYLEFTKANIIWEKNGQETIDFVETGNKIDLVLMDIRMPVVNGFDALKKIKEIRPDIPVIAITAYGDRKEREKGLKSGFKEYLMKPVTRNVLVKAILKNII